MVDRRWCSDPDCECNNWNNSKYLTEEQMDKRREALKEFEFFEEATDWSLGSIIKMYFSKLFNPNKKEP